MNSSRVRGKSLGSAPAMSRNFSDPRSRAQRPGNHLPVKSMRWNFTALAFFYHEDCRTTERNPASQNQAMASDASHEHNGCRFRPHAACRRVLLTSCRAPSRRGQPLHGCQSPKTSDAAPDGLSREKEKVESLQFLPCLRSPPLDSAANKLQMASTPGQDVKSPGLLLPLVIWNSSLHLLVLHFYSRTWKTTLHRTTSEFKILVEPLGSRNAAYFTSCLHVQAFRFRH